MYQKNTEQIRRLADTGLAMLREYYPVSEIDTGSLENFLIAGQSRVVKQYEIGGVGNLIVMTAPDEGNMQMVTFAITPYYKDLPFFTTDHMYLKEKRMFLFEIYDLVAGKDALYRKYIDAFTENCRMVSGLSDMPLKKGWYDDLRSVLASKTAVETDDDLILDFFAKNLSTFIAMEQEMPLLSDEQKSAKWEQNFSYARTLVENGGVSTKMFVESLGAEETKRFFYSVFFAPDRYR